MRLRERPRVQACSQSSFRTAVRSSEVTSSIPLRSLNIRRKATLASSIPQFRMSQRMPGTRPSGLDGNSCTPS
ncbi:hypothetical protein AFLA_000685 [Aspergillus flavus NRRL3357]|nr:hypothetical protein AFLA_000685 [Aspergillus flavus NRRL3357]